MSKKFEWLKIQSIGKKKPLQTSDSLVTSFPLK